MYPESFATPSPLDRALQTLMQGSFQDRWDIAKIIPGLGEESIAPLGQLLQHPDSEVRWFAARILGEFNHPQAINFLVELLATPEEELRAIASKSLAKLGEQNIPTLAARLGDPATRLLVVQALSQIYSEEIVPPLLGVIGDKDEMVRTTAIAALQSYEAPEIIPVLIHVLTDPVASVRCEAVTGLGLLASRSQPPVEVQDLVKLLTPYLRDLNLDVAQRTAIALRRIGTDLAVVSLGEFLCQNSAPLNLQIEIIRQLGWIAQTSVFPYLQWGLDQGSPELWLEIVISLGRLETLKSPACKFLVNLLDTKHPALARTDIRQALASSLGHLREPAGRAALVQLLDDPERSVQLHSQFALSLLPPEPESVSQL